MLRSLGISVLRISIATGVAILVLVTVFGLVVRQPNFGAYPFPEGPHADPAALREHVHFLTTDAFPRNPKHLPQLNRAADYIKAAFTRAGAEVSDQSYVAQGTECRNIRARWGPSSGRLLVVGAHYDVFGNNLGADDNASGAAGLLELARLLHARSIVSPRELVAFSTEEPPFFGSPEIGSAVHARALRAAGVQLTGMICLEMIGFYTTEQSNQNALLHLVYPRTGDFAVAVGRWADRDLVRQIKKAFRGATGVPIYSYSGPMAIGGDLSDHRNYWSEGYRAVMLTDTAYLRNPNYHLPSDAPETLDYRRMAGVVDGVLSLVIHFAGASTP